MAPVRVLGEVLGVFQFRDDDDFEGHIVLDACGVVVDSGGEVPVGGLTDEYQSRFHLFLLSLSFLFPWGLSIA